MAIKDSYPAIRPSLDLNFAGSRMVDPRITFTRASTGNIASYFNEKGVMQFAPANTPRIDFDPATLECNGLLIEEQRTNLLTYSEQFNNAAWVKTSATITANTATAPDGLMTADKFEPTGTGASYLYQGKTLTQGQEYTLSVFIKLVSGSGIVWLRDFTEPGNAEFNIVNGTIGTASGIATKPKMTAFDNGWYRISAVFTPTIATGNHNISCVHPASPSPGQGFYSWGAQLEVGSFPTSYIATTSAQVTCAADNAVMTGTNFSDWYRQDEGTLFAESSTLALSATDKRILSVHAGSTSNNMSLHFGGISGGVHTCVITTDNIFQYGPIEGAYVGNTYYKRALAYINSNPQVAKSGFLGSTAGASTTIVPTGLNSLEIGSRITAQHLNGHIRRIAYYPRRLANEQLQALTA